MDRHLRAVVALLDIHRRPRSARGRLHGGVGSQQQGLGAVGGHHEGGPDRWLPAGVEGVHEEHRWGELLDERGQGGRPGLELLQGFEFGLDVELGRRRRGRKVPLGVGELCLVARNKRVDPVVGLVELVLVVREEHHAAKPGADGEGQDQARDPEHATGQDPAPYR